MGDCRSNCVLRERVGKVHQYWVGHDAMMHVDGVVEFARVVGPVERVAVVADLADVVVGDALPLDYQELPLPLVSK